VDEPLKLLVALDWRLRAGGGGWLPELEKRAGEKCRHRHHLSLPSALSELEMSPKARDGELDDIYGNRINYLSRVGISHSQ